MAAKVERAHHELMEAVGAAVQRLCDESSKPMAEADEGLGTDRAFPSRLQQVVNALSMWDTVGTQIEDGVPLPDGRPVVQFHEPKYRDVLDELHRKLVPNLVRVSAGYEGNSLDRQDLTGRLRHIVSNERYRVGEARTSYPPTPEGELERYRVNRSHELQLQRRACTAMIDTIGLDVPDELVIGAERAADLAYSEARAAAIDAICDATEGPAGVAQRPAAGRRPRLVSRIRQAVRTSGADPLGVEPSEVVVVSDRVPSAAARAPKMPRTPGIGLSGPGGM
jgi:hypothetical protein